MMIIGKYRLKNIWSSLIRFNFGQPKKIIIQKQEYLKIKQYLSQNSPQSKQSFDALQTNFTSKLQPQQSQFFKTQQQQISFKLLQITSSQNLLTFLKTKQHQIQNINILFLFIYTFCKYQKLSSPKIQSYYQKLIQNIHQLDSVSLSKFYSLIYHHKNQIKSIPKIPKFIPNQSNSTTQLQMILIFTKLYPRQKQLLEWLQLIDQNLANKNPSIFWSIYMQYIKKDEKCIVLLQKWKRIGQNILSQLNDSKQLAQIMILAFQNNQNSIITTIESKINVDQIEIDLIVNLYFNIIISKNKNIIHNVKHNVEQTLFKKRLYQASVDSYIILWTIAAKSTQSQIKKKLIQFLVMEQQFLNFEMQQISGQQLFTLWMTVAYLKIQGNLIRKIGNEILNKLNQFNMDEIFYIWKGSMILKQRDQQIYEKCKIQLIKHQTKLNDRNLKQFKIDIQNQNKY